MPEDLKTTSRRGLITQIFISPDKPRLRAVWRLFIQTAFLLTFGLCLSVPIVVVLILIDPSIISFAQLKPEHMLIATLGETLVITVSVFLARRLLDKQSIESLGLKISI